MKCTIEVNMDNAAFERRPLNELQRIIAMKMNNIALAGWTPAEGDVDVPLIDVNGNKVGRLQVEVD